MDNPEKLATLGTQDEDKQNKKHHATVKIKLTSPLVKRCSPEFTSGF
jgi:hypothetical protein